MEKAEEAAANQSREFVLFVNAKAAGLQIMLVKRGWQRWRRKNLSISLWLRFRTMMIWKRMDTWCENLRNWPLMLSILTLMMISCYRIPHTQTWPAFTRTTMQQVLWQRFSIQSLCTASLLGSWRRWNVTRTRFSRFSMMLGTQEKAVEPWTVPCNLSTREEKLKDRL